jgi:hypothetical protein
MLALGEGVEREGQRRGGRERKIKIEEMER